MRLAFPLAGILRFSQKRSTDQLASGSVAFQNSYSRPPVAFRKKVPFGPETIAPHITVIRTANSTGVECRKS
jgi:hypothetical protein